MSDKTNPGEFKALRRMNRDVRQIKKSKHAAIDPRIAYLIQRLAEFDDKCLIPLEGDAGVYIEQEAADGLEFLILRARSLMPLIGGQS